MVNHEKKFIADAKHIFNTVQGRRVLVALKQLYVDVTSVQDTPELTYYALGRKELVQELINFVKDPDILMEIEKQERQETMYE